MFFERKIYQKFIAWKNEAQGHKALLVEGARRIGKSTIVEEFGKREYKSYILIDFARATDEVRGYFYQHLNDLDTFFMLLSVNYGVQLYDRESLIIFDEVQLFPKARESIKYLVADGRYDYIETGSLISIKENVKEIVVPSEERKIKMYPLDFEEFCGALGEGLIIPYIKTCFEKRQPLERGLHDKAMLLFKQYMLVGGMPKAVAVFLEGRKDFGKEKNTFPFFTTHHYSQRYYLSRASLCCLLRYARKRQSSWICSASLRKPLTGSTLLALWCLCVERKGLFFWGCIK